MPADSKNKRRNLLRPRTDGVPVSDERGERNRGPVRRLTGLTKPKHAYEYFPNLPQPKAFRHGLPRIAAAEALTMTGDSTL
jgi:hypothetical protein